MNKNSFPFCCFFLTNSKSGELLASVGSAPDYLLTIWRWREEAMVLHTKAFSQEVYRVSFSPNFEGRLTTSGMGHIRFWRMAETFTGLKLQGDIGKFGNVELSDVAAFVELPNGKIICGTETGTLLLWDGDLIQFVIMRNKTTPCHDGMIEFLCIEDGNTLISAGADGYLRFWDLNAILDGDVEGDSAFVLEPRQSVRIGGANTHVRVKGMLRGDAHWIVLDESGALWRLNVPAFTAAPLMRFHAGSVDALVVNRSSHHITAGGADGRLRCWDPHTKSIVFQRAFGSHEKNAPAITAIAPLPAALDPEAVMCAVGGADGVLRVVLRGVDRYSIAEIVKPHKCPITHVCYSPDGGQLATVGTDQTVFFFDCAPRQAYQPIGFIQLPSMPRSVCWSADSGQLLIAVSSEVLLVTRPQMSQVDTSTTFLITLRTRVFSFPAVCFFFGWTVHLVGF
jgi:WD40 repeat protein